MGYEPDHHHRKSIRLSGYDYSGPGGYFVTLVTHVRECLFGEIVNGVMHPTELGNIVLEEWKRSAEIRKEIRLDECVVMPNHFHGILFIFDPSPASKRTSSGNSCPPCYSQTPFRLSSSSLGSFIAGLKSAATKRANLARNSPGAVVWQRNYYERIIRNESDLATIRNYVAYNSSRWLEDRENPLTVKK
jgi:putative transposase